MKGQREVEWIWYGGKKERERERERERQGKREGGQGEKKTELTMMKETYNNKKGESTIT